MCWSGFSGVLLLRGPFAGERSVGRRLGVFLRSWCGEGV